MRSGSQESPCAAPLDCRNHPPVACTCATPLIQQYVRTGNSTMTTTANRGPLRSTPSFRVNARRCPCPF